MDVTDKPAVPLGGAHHVSKWGSNCGHRLGAGDNNPMPPNGYL
jgi:hypothetical protein